ncbi:MAG: pyridine nucleotide-disulfide oxidoreductase/dicluster-binding protein [Dehalobacterium sp.]
MRSCAVAMGRKDINNFEEKCIQEQLPACVASCPVHVDARKMNALIKKGDFDGALKNFSDKVVFPRIMSRICDHPCHPACKRNEVEAGISISLLEKACMDYGCFSERKIFFVRKKEKRVAVIGAGLSGLTAALSLADKGYDTTVFEKTSRLGGGIWEISEDILPRALIKEDFKIFENIGVLIKTNTSIENKIDMMRIQEEYDAVYLAYGMEETNPYKLKLDENNRIKISPETLQTDQAQIFAGGSLRIAPGKVSPIRSVADGKKAAVSIDRFLQNVSLTASRENEAPYLTKLYTNIAGVPEAPPVTPSEKQKGYSREEAVEEAGRCLQCQCLECVKACRYLAHYEKYPKKYIREISNNLAIIFGKKRAKTMINSCNMCGLCEEVCPNALDMGDVSRIARELMVEKGQMPMAIHDFPVRDMLFSNGEKSELHKNQPGFPESRYAFFPGCQLSAIKPEYIHQVYSYLMGNLRGGVGLMLRCCGAPAKWAGRKELFHQTLNEFYHSWKEIGEPEVILACSTCYQEIKENYPLIPIKSLWEIYDKYGLPEKTMETESGREIAVHDPCSSRHEQGFHESVRSILVKKGYQIKELLFSKEKAKCCGYGGLIFYSSPSLTEEIIKERIAESDLDYVTYCINCTDYFKNKGKHAWHLLDIVYGNAAGGSPDRSIGYSQRQENKAKLKEKMLNDFWGETMDKKREGFEQIKLVLSDNLLHMMDERLILKEDIQRVLYFAEEAKLIVYNPVTGHYTAHFKPHLVTYWVEYTKEDDQYVIHKTYSHRLEIAEDVMES